MFTETIITYINYVATWCVYVWQRLTWKVAGRLRATAALVCVRPIGGKWHFLSSWRHTKRPWKTHAHEQCICIISISCVDSNLNHFQMNCKIVFAQFSDLVALQIFFLFAFWRCVASVQMHIFLCLWHTNRTKKKLYSITMICLPICRCLNHAACVVDWLCTSTVYYLTNNIIVFITKHFFFFS